MGARPDLFDTQPGNGLTPGATYTFQVRAYSKLGFTGWSDSVSRMCI